MPKEPKFRLYQKVRVKADGTEVETQITGVLACLIRKYTREKDIKSHIVEDGEVGYYLLNFGTVKFIEDEMEAI